MLPLLLAAGASVAGSLIGGVLQGNAAKKAEAAETQRQREAIAAQQKASREVQQLQAPGVAAYGLGLNALTGRFGLNTTPVANAVATQQSGPDYGAYLAANPDVAAEYAQESTRDGKSRNNLAAQGISSAEDFARWHYETYGRAEGRAPPPIPAPAPAASPTTEQPAAPATNALTGSFGNTADPTWAPRPDFSFSVDSFKDNPAYKFAQEEGSGRVLASSAATGALQSGAALKALQDRGQKTAYEFYAPERDFAYGKYSDDFTRDRGVYESDRNYLTGRFDRGTDDLFRYTGVGQNALNATTNALVGEGNATATGLESIGNAQAGNALAQGNIWSGVVGNVAGTVAGLIKPKATAGTNWAQTYNLGMGS